MALLGDTGGVFDGLRLVGEERAHLLLAFEVELVGLKAHAVRVVDGLAGLDTEQDVLHPGVGLAQIVGVIGGDQGQPRLPVQAQNACVDLLLGGDAVVLELQVEVALSEDLSQLQGSLFGPLVVVLQQPLGDLAGKAGRQSDQAGAVGAQQIHVHAGTDVKALQKALADHIRQVAVALLVFAQQHQVPRVAVELIAVVKAGPRGDA